MRRLLALLAVRADALEALLGLALVTAGVALVHTGAALIVAGAILLAASAWPARWRG